MLITVLLSGRFCETLAKSRTTRAVQEISKKRCPRLVPCTSKNLEELEELSEKRCKTLKTPIKTAMEGLQRHPQARPPFARLVESLQGPEQSIRAPMHIAIVDIEILPTSSRWKLPCKNRQKYNKHHQKSMSFSHGVC